MVDALQRFVSTDPKSNLPDLKILRFDRTIELKGGDQELSIGYQNARGGANEELLEWCFRDKKPPNQEQILVWNAFIIKSDWRDASAPSLIVEKERSGFAKRVLRD